MQGYLILFTATPAPASPPRLRLAQRYSRRTASPPGGKGRHLPMTLDRVIAYHRYGPAQTGGSDSCVLRRNQRQ
jgi:hypothetical protein